MSREPSSILVVEDDPEVRESARRILEERGHRVLAVADGEAALRELEGGSQIDLLFTDIVMPGLDGFMLARRVKERRPAIKVLYATGYGDRVHAEIGVLYGKVVAKPYRARALQEEVDALLGTLPPEDSSYWREKAQQFRDAARLQNGAEAMVLEKRASEFEAMAEKMDG